jgi:hypothetical protein
LPGLVSASVAPATVGLFLLPLLARKCLLWGLPLLRVLWCILWQRQDQLGSLLAREEHGGRASATGGGDGGAELTEVGECDAPGF